MAQRSLVSSLVRGAALWAVPVLVISALALTWLYRSTVYSSFDDPLASAVTALIAAVEVEENGGLTLTREPIDPRYQQALSGRYWLVGVPEGDELKPRLASRSLYGETIILSSSLSDRLTDPSQSAQTGNAVGPDNGEPLRVVAQQLVLPGRSDPVIILAGADRSAAVRAIRNFGLAALSLMTILTLGLIVAVYTQVRLGLSPLFALRDRVADVREGRASAVGGDYPEEIDPLARELNSLIDHNKAVVERAQTHVGNLAHALKTPIAVLQNEARAAEATPSHIVSRQTEQMAAQVDHHLRRARAAARGQTIGVATEIDPVIQGLARTLPRIYQDKDLLIDIEGPDGLKFRGAARDLEDMVGNLMDNAAKWTVSHIRVTRFDVANQIHIRVEDDGPGLKQEDFETALKRGERLDEATPGSGLGLAIVDELATAYQGGVKLGRSEMGGLRVDLTLPRAIT